MCIPIVFSGCLSAPNKEVDCAKVEGGPTICEKPEKSQFIEDFFDASESNAKARANDKTSQSRKKNLKDEKSDVAVGFITAIFKMLGGLFSSDD